MRPQVFALMLLFSMAAGHGRSQDAGSGPRGVSLDSLPWPAAADRLTAEAVIVIPLAPGAVQHGPHLTLGTDARLTEYVTGRLLQASDVVAAPALTYSHHPGFDEYAGSASIAAATARDLTMEIVRSIARHGPRRFYVLDTGATDPAPLAASARGVAAEGILLRYTDARGILDGGVIAAGQPEGGHADEIETSMMLQIAPDTVDMRRAVRDIGSPSRPLRLTRRPGEAGTYSPSGVFGDPRLATAEKGRVLIEALVGAVIRGVEALRRAPLPGPVPAPPPARPAPGVPLPPTGRPARAPGDCPGADEGAIRMLGPAFSKAWLQLDAGQLSALWAPEGDMLHPDGFAEGSAQVIRQNRAYLFGRREYRDSRHPLQIGQIRCITPDVAIAEGKWELRGVVDAAGQPVPATDGLCTLVLRKITGVWRIEAYRYTVTPQTPRPMVLPQPGPTGR